MSGLERLLRPKSIAAIGGLPASRVVEQCQLMGFKGDIWPVHPTKKEIRGLPAFASVEDLPARDRTSTLREDAEARAK